MTQLEWYRWEDDALLLKVYIQPRASKDKIVGLQDNRLKVRITAPPVAGKANEKLIRYLAGEFKVAKSCIHVISGQGNRIKRLRIQSPGRIPDILREYMGSGTGAA